MKKEYKPTIPEASAFTLLLITACFIGLGFVSPNMMEEASDEYRSDPAPSIERIMLEFAGDTVVPLPQEDSTMDFIEPMPPRFPGGDMALFAFLANNIVYPKEAVSARIEGVVPVQFMIEVDGSTREVVALRDPGGGLAEEAVRVVKTLPAWIPAEDFDGHPVRTRYVLPVRFRLEK